MRKLVAIMALGMLVTGGAYAQGAPQKEKKQRTEYSANKGRKAQVINPEARAARQTEMLSRKLGLSAAQKNELQALNMRKVQEMQALNEKYDKSDLRNEAQRAERKAIQDRWHADMKTVLNEKQYAQYEADRKEKREKLNKGSKTEGRKINKEKRQKQNG
jgi:protein CpxP